MLTIEELAMSVIVALTTENADPGQAWIRYQTDRLHQRHLQFGRHCRLDLHALLSRAARIALATTSATVSTARENVSIAGEQSATITAIDRGARR